MGVVGKHPESVIWKLGPLKIRRTIAEYYDLHRSEIMRESLDERDLRFLVRQRKKGRAA